MRFLKVSLLALLFAFAALAEEKAEEKPDPGTAPLPKDQKEYIDKTSKLTTLTNRIAEHERQFNELVRKKAAAKSAAEKQAIIQEMVEVSKQRNKDVDQHTKLKAEVSLRYPNQGEHLNRRYQTQHKRSVEELEGAAGLDELLTRTKKIVDKKFAPFMEEESKAESKPQVAKPSEEKPKRLRLEK